jgi:purine-nucleoside phosphorylase
MINTPTPHNGAKLGEIAKTVLMPGDPLRAKFIAENFLEDVVQFNSVRNMLGYTGTYKGKRISVMGGGMGIPSIGIYSYELFNYYDVDNIIRIGTAGSVSEKLHLRDIVIGLGASTDSNYASQYNLPGTFAPIASFELAISAFEMAKENNINTVIGNILSSDIFYNADKTALERWKNMGILAVEMEAAALYMNAAEAGKNALCLLTISDCPFTGESLSAEERQLSFTEMMKIALEVAK